MHVGCFESIGFVEYIAKNIGIHAFVEALLFASILLRGMRSL
jgi:hypothetical protein